MKDDQRDKLKDFVSHHLGGEFTEGQHYAMLSLLEDFYDTFIVGTSVDSLNERAYFSQPKIAKGEKVTLLPLTDQQLMEEAEDFDEQFEGGVK